MNGLGRALVAIAVVLAVGASGCTSKEDQIQDHLARADEQLRAGDEKAALIELRSALQLAPQSGPINVRIGNLMAGQGRASDALFFYDEAMRLDPGLEEAKLGAARILTFTDAPKAGELLQALIESDPANAQVYTALANLKLATKDVDGALAPALTAVELAPKDPQTQLQLGRVYQAQIQIASKEKPAADATFTAATEAFDRAREAAGDDVQVAMEAAFERARVLAAWPGHLEQARDAYLALIDQAKASGDEHRLRNATRVAVTFATRSGNADVVGTMLEKAVDSDPEYLRPWLQLAAFEEREGRSGDAVYERLLAQQPRNGKAHIARAEHLEQTGRVDEAIEKLRGAVDQVEEPIAVRLALVEMLYRVGRGEEGAESLAALERDAPDAVETKLASSTAAMMEGRYADAVGILEPLAASLERPSVSLKLAEAQLRLGDLPAATATIDHAMQSAPSPWPAGLSLKLAIQQAAGDWQALLQTAEQLRRSPAGLTYEQRVTTIRALYETGRAAVARRLLDELLAKPDPRPGVVSLFVRWEGANDPERARALLEKVIAEHPDERGLVLEMATFEAKRGDVKAALARLDATLAALPEGQSAPRVQLLRAQLRLQTGDAAGAESDALAAFRAAPELPEAAQLVSAIAVSRKRVPETIAAFEQELQAGALPLGSRALLGRLYLIANRDDDAITMLDEVVKQGGGDVAAKNDLAFLLAKHQRDLDRALQLAQQAVAGSKTNSALFDTLGYVYLQKGLYGPALDQFDQAIELARQEGSEHAEYHYRRGLALRGLERSDEAMKAFEAALSLDPGFEEARQARAALQNGPEHTGDAS